MKYNGMCCPKCQGAIQIGDDGLKQSDTTTAYQNIRCLKCKTSFAEAYVLSSLDEFDDEGNLVTTHEIVP